MLAAQMKWGITSFVVVVVVRGSLLTTRVEHRGFTKSLD